ncbi:MAG: (Fe-S)-binding protein, partial [Muribaculaceae bacterium]|nr:(Fe-S)-binding protein [Muribaculaceae bacterium]
AGVGRVIGPKAVTTIGRGLHNIGIPLWTPALPGAAKVEPLFQDPMERKVVYFPSCINQTMGATREKDGKPAQLTNVMVELCHKAGYEVIYPEGMNNLCCGMIWDSKGFPETAEAKIRELEAALYKASEHGRYPVLCDQSPCLHRMREHIKSMKLYEPVEFILDYLAPHLEFTPTDEHIAIHVTCSSRLMGLASKMEELARRCSNHVLVPAEVGCCGFAGDKGFTHPKLNNYALRKLAPQIKNEGVTHGYSNSRTCEIGLTTNAGVPYKSIAYLVNSCTKPKKTTV